VPLLRKKNSSLLFFLNSISEGGTKERIQILGQKSYLRGPKGPWEERGSERGHAGERGEKCRCPSIGKPEPVGGEEDRRIARGEKTNGLL